MIRGGLSLLHWAQIVKGKTAYKSGNHTREKHSSPHYVQGCSTKSRPPGAVDSGGKDCYSMRVIINHRLCTGCGVCGELCPQVFMVTECFAFLRVKSIPPRFENECRLAASRCPLAALSILYERADLSIGLPVRQAVRGLNSVGMENSQ